jgi:hypothetical protein
LEGVVPLNIYIEHDTWGMDMTDFITSYVNENTQVGGDMYSIPY